jgi:cobalt-zinc-cadmium efflux system membrane fusion protein
MTFSKKNLLVGGAAIALLGGGLTTGAILFGGDRSHVGETAEQHAAELGAAAKETDHDDHDAEEAGHEAGEAEHGGEEHAEGEVEIDAAAIERAQIGLVTIAPGSLGAEISAQATVAAAPNGEAILTARAAGAITDIRKRLGDPVRRGEMVALVLSPEAAALSAALTSAKSRLDLAKTTFEREKTLYESKVTSRQDFETAQAELAMAEAEYRRSEMSARAAGVSSDGQSVAIASQIDGRITAVTAAAKLGAYVSPDTELFRIADPTKIQIEAAVPVLDAQRIRPGDAASIEANGATHAAKVRAVTPSVDAASRAATVVLELDVPTAQLQPGQYARALIRPAAQQTDGPTGFVVPEEAIQNVEGRDVVFVRTDEGFLATPVSVGQRGGGRAEIVQGLEPGQVIAGRKAFVLKAELGKGDAGHDH